ELFELIKQGQENFTYNLKLSMIEKIQDLLVDRHAQAGMYVQHPETALSLKIKGTNRDETFRSHSILFIEVIGDSHITRDKTFGKLYFIDLAGSERTERFGAIGERMTETRNISRFLSALSDVIADVSQDIDVVNISPSVRDLDETFCSLQFADRVQNTDLASKLKCDTS
ncbi:kinesin family protein (KlpA), partial [Reticulomyxa filosa]